MADFGQNERIIQLKVLQPNGLPGLRLIKLGLLVGSMERAVAFSGDGVCLVHLPPGKEEEGTALPPDEPNRTFPVGSGA